MTDEAKAPDEAVAGDFNGDVGQSLSPAEDPAREKKSKQAAHDAVNRVWVAKRTTK